MLLRRLYNIDFSAIKAAPFHGLKLHPGETVALPAHRGLARRPGKPVHETVTASRGALSSVNWKMAAIAVH
ncbi:hypothetical protein [Undibacter mobilis]|uniref:hypothetical protein n=1 Tax=Undibacter mobilis TaxID=2292256 RepID=UPI001AEC7837|nr:hypothetical protein [Undibacter mobilis]